MVRYERLRALPVFCRRECSSHRGRPVVSSVLYVAIPLGHFVDGLLARGAGQYSRMAALVDPLGDRLTVLAGAAVCWHFELLPRWALAILAARELATLVLSQMALRRGIDIEVNWIGRIGVFLVFGGIFWTLVLDWEILEIAFVAGVVITLAATIVYVRAALGQHPAASEPPPFRA